MIEKSNMESFLTDTLKIVVKKTHLLYNSSINQIHKNLLKSTILFNLVAWYHSLSN